jgi:hypothetical protein
MSECLNEMDNEADQYNKYVNKDLSLWEELQVMDVNMFPEDISNWQVFPREYTDDLNTKFVKDIFQEDFFS